MRYTPGEYQSLNDQAKAAADQADALAAELATATGDEQVALQQQIDDLRTEQAAQSTAALKTLNWRMIWGIPAILAAIVAALFAVLFRNPKQTPA